MPQHPLKSSSCVCEDVIIVFDDGCRPNTTLKLVLTAGETTMSKEFGKGASLRWDPKLECSDSPILTVKIYKKWAWMKKFPKQIAFDVAKLSAMKAGKLSVPIEKQNLVVIFSFSGVPNSVTSYDDEFSNKLRNVREGASKSRAIVNEKTIILKSLGWVDGLVKSGLEAGSIAAEFNPIAKAVVSSLKALYKLLEKQQEYIEKTKGLTKKLELFLSIKNHYEKLKYCDEARLAFKRMLDLIAQISDYIIEHASNKYLGNPIAKEFNDQIKDFTDDFTSAKETFDRSMNLATLETLRDIQQYSYLEKLKPATRAHYPSGADHECLKGTRLPLRNVLLHWLYDQSNKTERMFWLYGSAGAGKSSIATTFAKTVDDDDDYDFSCFFCKRDDKSLSSPSMILPTLAYRMQKYYFFYRAALFKLVRSPKGDGLATGDISKQFELLFEDLLPRTNAPLRSHVIVIDALDECGTPEEQAKLVSCLSSLAKSVPWIQVFITSRPEVAIKNAFLSCGRGCIQSNIDEDPKTNEDIKLYIQYSLLRRNVVLCPDDIVRLVQQAAGLFIWCSTLFKYLERSRNPSRDLKLFLTKSPKLSPFDQLYKLYDQVLDSAVERNRSDDVHALQAILGIIYVSASNRLLSADAISHFLRLDTRFEEEDKVSVQNTVRALHAVLYEDRNLKGAIRVNHPSFLDFIQNKLNSSRFCLTLQQTHELVLRGCLGTLHQELKFNICKLRDSSLPNRKVSDPRLCDRVLKYVSEALQYSVLFWFAHFAESGLQSHAESELECILWLFRTTKFFFWLEVLSVTNAVGQGIMILQKCLQHFAGLVEFQADVGDLWRFVTAYSEPIAESAPHIYLSALPWLPEYCRTQTGAIKDLVKFKNLPLIVGKDEDWQGARWTKNVGSSVLSVAYSADEIFFAAGTLNGSICIWNADTYQTFKQLIVKDSGSVYSVIFSPNSQYIVAGYGDMRIRIWDVWTGRAVGKPLEGHTGKVYSVAISKDSKYIVSGSSDRTVGIWNFHTREKTRTFEGHSRSVPSVVFCPSGRHVVSSSRDRTIRIWDIDAGVMVGQPLQGHKGRVESVAVSPSKNAWIASGSTDRTIRVWSMEGKEICDPLRGHVRSIRSVAFSPDGNQIISGSKDYSIRIWARPRNYEDHRLIGKRNDSQEVHSVAFSPDGRIIISGSELGFVRIWDAEPGIQREAVTELQRPPTCTRIAASSSGERIASIIEGEYMTIWDPRTGATIGKPSSSANYVYGITFSPDGQCIASTCTDGTLVIWDNSRGNLLAKTIRGNSALSDPIAFSPDSQHIASSSDDKTIRILDIRTGKEIRKPLSGCIEKITSIAFYPNGRRIVSGSGNGIVCMWDLLAGTTIGEPLISHSDSVRALAVSPNGQFIASGSDDNTVRVWKAQSGAAIGEPFKDHTGSVRSVAISADSARIVSCDDETVRIWDIHGTMLCEPFQISGSLDSVAFSPDGQRIISVYTEVKEVSILDARLLPSNIKGGIQDAMNGHDLEAMYGQWNAYCSRMDETDGWVKDEHGKLLLWIPHRYRSRFRERVLMECRAGREANMRPVVDAEKLFAYAGRGWTKIYKSNN